MVKFTQSATGQTDIRKIWQLYVDTDSWSRWDKSVKAVRLAGPFAEGTQGVMEMQAGPSLPFRLSELVEGQSFTVTAALGPLTVSFGHLLQAEAAGLSVTHSVEVQGGEEAQMRALGQGIAAGLPDCLQNLLAMAGGL